MSVSDNILSIKNDIPDHVKLVAVSKFHPADVVQQAYSVGQRIFGESRMQELEKKYTALPKDIEWHFIGHLQTNKVKTIVPYIHTIHSVDSWKLLSEIDKQALAVGRSICCLLEVHIAREESKYGLSYDECIRFLSEGLWKDCKHAYIGGLMGMATYTDDKDQIRSEFKGLKLFFDEIKDSYFPEDSRFSELSMGMSGDYLIAIEEGATMIRVGSSIFGEREY